MNWKAILSFFVFFVATPILLGQAPTGTPTVPPFSTETPSFGTSTPALSSALPALNATDLSGAGLNTDAMSQSLGERAEQNQSNYTQGLPQQVPSSEIPTVDSAGLASRFAQQLFPQEYNAAQGGLGNVPQSTALPSGLPSALPSDLPSSIPSSPSLPSSLPTASPTPPSF